MADVPVLTKQPQRGREFGRGFLAVDVLRKIVRKARSEILGDLRDEVHETTDAHPSRANKLLRLEYLRSAELIIRRLADISDLAAEIEHRPPC